MKVGQNFLIAALVAVLALIAYDLHRLTNVFYTRIPIVSNTVPRDVAVPETREQRNERLRREVNELAEDWKAMLEDPKPAPRKGAPPSGQSIH